MNWQDFLDYMTRFRTDRIVEQLHAWNLGDLSQNPYVLGALLLGIALLYFIGLKTISGFIAGLGVFLYALSFAVTRGTDTAGVFNGGVWIIIGGGALACGLFIYLVFIRSD